MAEIAFNACNTPGEVVFADFARELERENAGLREALETSKVTLTWLWEDFDGSGDESTGKQIRKTINKVDKVLAGGEHQQREMKTARQKMLHRRTEKLFLNEMRR